MKKTVKNCSECKWRQGSFCKKTKETVNMNDWCSAGRKK